MLLLGVEVAGCGLKAIVVGVVLDKFEADGSLDGVSIGDHPRRHQRRADADLDILIEDGAVAEVAVSHEGWLRTCWSRQGMMMRVGSSTRPAQVTAMLTSQSGHLMRKSPHSGAG